ncbi:AlpA family phage regulatory protein [Paraburkholderia sp. A1RI-2L]|uniref:helix-turn-helix transcriptional regulator n=1 Tax=Paraburkholderia sp. A1RI-2L TaxID=3028367 RepID=UPI003B7CA95B
MPTPSKATSPAPRRIIRMRALSQRIGLSKTEIYRRLQSGSFVTPLKLGERSIGFDEAEVDAWLAALPRVEGK